MNAVSSGTYGTYAYTGLQGRLARQATVFALGVRTHNEGNEHNIECVRKMLGNPKYE